MAELTPRMKELVQPYLAGIEPYDPNFTPTRINLSANENTYPVPAGVREAIDAALAATPLNRYPDPMSNELRDELATWHGVTRENICVGNGGDELLYNYLLAFGGAGRTLLNCPPCFSEYAFFASLCQTEVRDVWRDPATFELDQAAALACVRARDAYAPVVAQVASERERELAALRAMAAEGLPVEAWPSAANFVLVRTPHATRVRERLRDEYSILVRDFSYAPGLADCLRITAGTPQENDEVLAAFVALVKEEM